jgi:hypothetical protein
MKIIVAIFLLLVFIYANVACNNQVMKFCINVHCICTWNLHANDSVFVLQGAGQERLGIYIKSVVKGGAADAVSSFA